VDKYGNFILELQFHHVPPEEKGFISKMWHDGKLRADRESKVEAFSKVERHSFHLQRW